MSIPTTRGKFIDKRYIVFNTDTNNVCAKHSTDLFTKKHTAEMWAGYEKNCIVREVYIFLPASPNEMAESGSIDIGTVKNLLNGVGYYVDHLGNHYPANKIGAIKYVHGLTGCGLKEAKDFVEGL